MNEKYHRGALGFEDDWRAGESHLLPGLSESEILAQLSAAHEIVTHQQNVKKRPEAQHHPQAPLLRRTLAAIPRAIAHMFAR
ncbi:hypothetical protein HY357_00680 [Candidatus Roizmanbacteria bacterium]|nr:hypothetical protein [Candidatus Roizmanbacteria bacterium]